MHLMGVSVIDQRLPGSASGEPCGVTPHAGRRCATASEQAATDSRNRTDAAAGLDVARLTRLISAGDREAFGLLYEAWFDRSLTIARAVTGRDESFCLDVVQNSMIRVARSMKPMDSSAALAAWMASVVRSAAIDQLRRETRRVRRERKSAGDAVTSSDRLSQIGSAGFEGNDGTDPGWGSRLEWLRSELADLDAHDADLILQRFARDRTLEQLAGTLNHVESSSASGRTGLVSASAVHGRIRRLLARLARASSDVKTERAEEAGRHSLSHDDQSFDGNTEQQTITIFTNHKQGR